MLVQALNLAQKEFIQVWRDKVLMVFVVLGPIIQFVLLAQTAGGDITHLPLAVVDQDKSSTSRELVKVLDNTQELDLRFYLDDSDQISRMLDLGQARLGVVIPRRFAANLGGGVPVAVQMLADGSNYLEGSTAIRVAQGALADLVERGALSGGGDPGGIDLRTRVEFNPQLNLKLHTIPAQMSFIVFQISLLVAALSFARERELGTLEQLRITPISQAELLAGKAILALIVGMLDFVVVFAMCLAVFQLPMRGSVGDLLALTLLFVAANVTMGLVVSVLCSSQQQALLLVFLICVLQINVSGYLLSVNNMPVGLQMLAEFSPLRHYLTGVREIMLKGTPLALLVQSAISLLLLAVAAGATAWGLLKRRGD